jgi:putative hydrolase of the HAD superfamily
MKRIYSVIVFDLGNVLIPFSYDSALEKLNLIDKGLGDRFWRYYKDNYQIHRDFERGSITEEDFVGRMLHVLENKINHSEFCELYSKVFKENTEVSALLPILKQKYILVLLSNTNSIHMEYGWKDYEFLKYFDKLILSHQVNALKPEEKIYRSVEEFSSKPAAEHIFIDDIEEYVSAAKVRGWDGIVFSNHEQLKQDLIRRGIL